MSAKLGRAPSLTARGQAWAVGAALLIVVGALGGAWRVAAAGVLSLSALLCAYLAFFPTSVVIWRRHVELQWGIQREGGETSLVAGRPFKLVVTLRNLSPRTIGRALLRVYASPALSVPERLALSLKARREVTVGGQIWPQRAGYWSLHGAAVEVSDLLGVCVVEAYFPSPVALKIFPRPSPFVAPPPEAQVTGAPHERLGLHALRQRGLGGDLRELREHAPGDPFKQIAWKATARTGKLMVRDLDRETMVTHFLLVDLGSTMRDGPIGLSRLDRAVDLANAYARGALEAGDRVGLITFDGRIVSEVRPNDGPVHRLRLVEPLMHAMNAVDDDLTDLTDSELVETVARYLLFQDGVDARVARAPALDDPAWAHLVSAPSGDLYDVRRILKSAANTDQPGDAGLYKTLIRAVSPELAQLRRFCRQRGIPLPHLRVPEPGRRARGMAEALERAAAGRGTQRILVLSDLEGLTPPGLATDAVARAVRLVRRRGHQLVCAVPSGRPATPLSGDPGVVAQVEVAGWDLDRRERAAKRQMAQLGVRVVSVQPGESAAQLIARLSSRGRVRPRVA
jgi:uncharacterized protein (DUF58 family)